MSNDKVKIGIATDPWKVNIFKKVLEEDGYKEYKVAKGGAFSVIQVVIHPEELVALQVTIKKANQRAKKSKQH